MLCSQMRVAVNDLRIIVTGCPPRRKAQQWVNFRLATGLRRGKAADIQPASGLLFAHPAGPAKQL
jgi:hypothetical protein